MPASGHWRKVIERQGPRGGGGDAKAHAEAHAEGEGEGGGRRQKAERDGETLLGLLIADRVRVSGRLTGSSQVPAPAAARETRMSSKEVGLWRQANC